MIYWRALLFVPAHDVARLARAHERQADVIILDLEDGVAASDKAAARANVANAAARLEALGIDVVVRVNYGAPSSDLEAALHGGVGAIMLPKIETLDQVRDVEQRLDAFGREGRPNADSIKLIALLETPLALEHLSEIASAPRVGALALGVEDFAAALGVEPGPENLDLPCRMIAIAAAAHGKAGFGAPISIAVFGEPDLYEAAVRRARAMGLTGALCIHPAQVRAVNAAFAPSAAEIEHAEAVLSAWGEGTRGIVRLGQRMIDAPLVRQARRTLARRP